ncbi:MAG: thiamine pyrophosphate-binding protein [Pirellulales bacterium]
MVTAGQSDRRILFEEPILASDMVAVTRPWTKWAAQVERVEDVPVAVRRAVQTALTPPTGPVFLSLPMDIQTAEADLDLAPARVPDRRVRPPLEALCAAAALLAGAKNPGIIAGSRVVEGGAVPALVELAQRLGAPVFSESATSHGRAPFPAAHPLNAQQLPLWAPDVHAALAEFDVLLAVGLDLLRMYIYHEPPQAVPSSCRLVHLDENPWQIGKNYPAEVGLIGDVRTGLEELASLTTGAMTAAQVDEARARGKRRSAAHAEVRKALAARIAAEREARPMMPATLMETVGRILPPNVAVVEEAVTTTEHLLERLGTLPTTDGYFAHRGWSLGWGLGLRDRREDGLARSSDARTLRRRGRDVRHSRPLDGGPLQRAGDVRRLQQRALSDSQRRARMLGLPAVREGRFIGMDLDRPSLDILKLAEGFGVEAVRVSEPDELAEVLKASLAGDRPRVIDVSIQKTRASQFG